MTCHYNRHVLPLVSSIPRAPGVPLLETVATVRLGVFNSRIHGNQVLYHPSPKVPNYLNFTFSLFVLISSDLIVPICVSWFCMILINVFFFIELQSINDSKKKRKWINPRSVILYLFINEKVLNNMASGYVIIQVSIIFIRKLRLLNL